MKNYEITVVDGVVTKVVSHGVPVPPGEVAGLPKTVPELFALIRGLPERAVASVRYDLGPGVPTVIAVDPDPTVVDEEYSITVFGFTPAS